MWEETTNELCIKTILPEKITTRDLHSLKGNELVNDKIIFYYLNLLRIRDEKLGKKTFVFDTKFYPELKKTSVKSVVERWYNKTNVFQYENILIPIIYKSDSDKNNHWCLVTIDFNEKSMSYFNSFHTADYECINLIRTYFCEKFH